MGILPSDGAMLEELRELKKMNPSMGVHRLSASLHTLQPSWRFNSKRVRSILKTHGLMCKVSGSSSIPYTGPSCLSESPVTVDVPVYDDITLETCSEEENKLAVSSDQDLESSDRTNSTKWHEEDEECFPCDEDYIQIHPEDLDLVTTQLDEDDGWLLLP